MGKSNRRCGTGMICFLVMALSLMSACSSSQAENTSADGQKTGQPTVSESSVSDGKTADGSDVDENEAGKDGADNDEADGQSASNNSPETTKAFADAIKKFYTQHILPDGSRIDYNSSFGDFSDNKFAICDVDSDGSDELLVLYETCSMAEMQEHIYKYDETSKKLVSELSEFPGITAFSNGMIKAGWSHNHGLGNSDRWPYTLYTYNKTDDCYEVLILVDSWDKSIAETDSDGNKYPDDVDVNNDGFVYLITFGEDCDAMSKKEYETWYSGEMKGAREIKIPYKNFTAENVNNVNNIK